MFYHQSVSRRRMIVAVIVVWLLIAFHTTICLLFGVHPELRIGVNCIWTNVFTDKVCFTIHDQIVNINIMGTQSDRYVHQMRLSPCEAILKRTKKLRKTPVWVEGTLGSHLDQSRYILDLNFICSRLDPDLDNFFF